LSPILVIFSKDSGEIEWNRLNGRVQAIEFIKHHYSEFIKGCGYDEKLVSKRLLVISVPDYMVTPLKITKPNEAVLSLD
jgi:hypothetical protein